MMRAERAASGKRLRDRVRRTSHAEWNVTERDPIEILEASNEGRLPELIPIRYGRMLQSPFTFLRGSAAVMARDLAETASTGVQVQACGDCHLLNFGLFATPERHLVFELNDFDETHPAPWEWDLKRLAASFAVAARDNGFSDRQGRLAATICARSYREHVADCSRRSPLEIWYQRLDFDEIVAAAPDTKARRFRERWAEKARRRVVEHLFPAIATDVDGRCRLIDQPPFVFHVSEDNWDERVAEGLVAYRESLPDERRVLLDRYRFEDSALKLVGIGSVGTRCHVALLRADGAHPLILQFKEARRSVLEPYTEKSRYANQGQRVVTGQRLLQSSSDIFLGWARGRRGFDFYVRQLRDMKFSLPVEGFSSIQLERYADFCGRVLARAHAKSGDAAAISGYLGRSERFDDSLGRFALAYADQTERDHAALVKAVRTGRVQALGEDDAG
jgi:uncharacterized protein (DUF2252 family)